MTLAVIAWQIFIFVTIAISGSKRGWVTLGWVVWTLFQVYTLPLSIVQFLTIYLAYQVSKPKQATAHPATGMDHLSSPASAETPKTAANPEPLSTGLYDSEKSEFKVANCKFVYKCNRSWSELTQIPGANEVRFCGTCRESVYFCSNAEELVRNIRAKRCVAFKDEKGVDLVGDVCQ
ncbi:hypothetical protein GCM10025793_12720 [Lysobacter lycopersici]